MRNPTWCSAFTAAILAGWLYASDNAAPVNKEPARNSPVKTQAPKKKADNSRCYVCHLNYEDEELAEVHAKNGVGCVKCHGESLAHAGDEDNITAPDIMYPKAKLNAACLKCHKADKLEPLEQHHLLLAGLPAKEKYCTDCHGEHRLKNRRNQWDKETHKLLKPAKN